MAAQTLEERYMTDSVVTATPATCVVMLYDRLVDDLELAAAGLDVGDITKSHNYLVHAQDIIFLLRVTLRTDVWSAATTLKRLYEFFNAELVQANIHHDAQRIRTSLAMIRQLASAWRRAAESVVAEGAPAESDPEGASRGAVA